MPLATGPASALLAIALQAVSGSSDPDTPCFATPYVDAWGRTSDGGDLTLCRIPAGSAGVEVLEYELRAGNHLLWQRRLPRRLDEAVVSADGTVDGFALFWSEPPRVPLAWVVTIGPSGTIDREWRLGVEPNSICGTYPPALVSIARIDRFHVAAMTGNDDLVILDVRRDAPIRTFHLGRVGWRSGETSWIAEWDVLPGAEIAAVRVGYRARRSLEPTGIRTIGERGQLELGTKVFVVTADGSILWSRTVPCLQVPPSSALENQSDAERDFRQDGTDLMIAADVWSFRARLCAASAPLVLRMSKDALGEWRATADP